MAVTLKIEDKKAANVEPAPDLSDYAAPEERAEGTKAFLIWFILMLLLTIAFSLLEFTRTFGIILGVWWLGSAFAYFVLAPRLVLRRLRMHGDDIQINARKQPHLYNVLTKGSALLSVDRPEGFIVQERTPVVKLLGGANKYLIINQGAVDLLQPAELDCLVMRTLVQARQNHVRRLMLLQFLGDTPPMYRILAWPMSFYAALLNMTWHELADQTADRITLLLVKNPNLLLSSLLKQISATDPLMMENNVTAEDVDNYIRQGGAIDAAGISVSTQYKIGSAIGDNPYVEERVTALNTWARSPEYKTALQKLADAKSGAKSA